jgi:hypothetical protein
MIDLIDVSPTLLAAGDVTFRLQIRQNPVNGPFRYIESGGNLSRRALGLSQNVQEHQSMVRDKGPFLQEIP